MVRQRLLFISILGTEDMVQADLFDDHPDGRHDASWMCCRLAEAGVATPPGVQRVDVCADEALPAIDSVDAVVVGGSYHNVDEGHAWQRRTMDWLREWRRTSRPFLGICGGHQMAAVVLGGRVSRMPVGPWAETAAVTLTEAGRRHYLFDGLGDSLDVHLGHYDHVDGLPPGAVVLAEREGVVQALDFGGDWLGVQFHPEVSPSLMKQAWAGALGDLGDAYRPSSVGGRLLCNFLRAHGLLDADGQFAPEDRTAEAR